MMTKNGALRLFSLFGIEVYLSWTWLLGGLFFIWQQRLEHSIGFYILLYLALFCMVLMHEFGHSLACKSVGGKAELIVLNPFGGVAWVSPPQRPGAVLWSIAAGPLVNVVLVPITVGVSIATQVTAPGVIADFFLRLAQINAALLIFNMMPIYPLDGGQILRSLLWFIFGRGLSLMISAAIGMLGGVAIIIAGFVTGDIWLALIFMYLGQSVLDAWKNGRALYQLEHAPNRPDFSCPRCGKHPPIAAIWNCQCGAVFDTFATNGTCPGCGRLFDTTTCPLCNTASPFNAWYPRISVTGGPGANVTGS